MQNTTMEMAEIQISSLYSTNFVQIENNFGFFESEIYGALVKWYRELLEFLRVTGWQDRTRCGGVLKDIRVCCGDI